MVQRHTARLEALFKQWSGPKRHLLAAASDTTMSLREWVGLLRDKGYIRAASDTAEARYLTPLRLWHVENGVVMGKKYVPVSCQIWPTVREAREGSICWSLMLSPFCLDPFAAVVHTAVVM